MVITSNPASGTRVPDTLRTKAGTSVANPRENIGDRWRLDPRKEHSGAGAAFAQGLNTLRVQVVRIKFSLKIMLIM